MTPIQLQTFHIQRLQKHQDTIIAFKSPVTMIEGPNEFGKTTIIRAIVAMLFYNPTKPKKAFEQHQSWESNQLFELTLKFSYNNQEYIFHKDFEHQEAVLTNTTTEESWNSWSDIETILLPIWPYTNEQLFEKLCVLSHQELTQLHKGKRSLDDALHHIQHEHLGAANPREILSRLEKKQKELTKGMDHIAKEPGTIKNLEEEIHKLTEKSTQLRLFSSQYQENEEQQRTSENEYQKLQEQRHVLQKQLEETKQLQVLEEAFARASNEYDATKKTINDAEALSSQIIELEKFTSGNMASTKELSNELHAAYQYSEKLATLKKEIQLNEKRAGHKEINEIRIKKRRNYIMMAVGLSVVFIILGITISPWFFFLLIMSGGLIIKFVRRKKEENDNTNNTIQIIRQQYIDQQAQLQSLLIKYNVKNIEALSVLVERMHEKQERLQKLRGMLEGALKGTSLYRLKIKREELEKELAITKQQMELLQIPAGINVQQIEHRLEKIQKQEQENIRIIESLRVKMQNAANQKEELLETNELLREKKLTLKKAKNESTVLRIVEAAIIQSQQQATHAFMKGIEELMGELLSIITNDKYRHIRLTSEYTFEIEEQKTKQWISPNNILSTGTVDQIYVAARLALIANIWNNTNIVVLLDDPFLTFDDERTRAMRTIFSKLKNMQFVLVTHSSLQNLMPQ